MKTKICSALFLTCLLSACSITKPSPQLYPNDKLKTTGDDRIHSDISHCMALADQYISEPDIYETALKDGVTGAVIGAGTGAVSGAIFSNAGRGTAAGAAVGGILGILNALRSSNDYSPSYQRFVEHCLQKEGYEIVGWGRK